MIISILAGAVLFWLLWDVGRGSRRQRERESLRRHVAGSLPWWGQR